MMFKFLIICLSVFSLPAAGQVTYSSIASGDWHDPRVWNTGTVPAFTDHVHIGQQTAILVNSPAECNNICIDADGSLALNSAINIHGSWDNSGTVNAKTGKVCFTGNLAQNIGGTVTSVFHNLEINNAQGVSLVHDQCVRGVLTLTKGSLSTNGKMFILLSDHQSTAAIADIKPGCSISGTLYREHYMGFLVAGEHVLYSQEGRLVKDWLHDSTGVSLQPENFHLYTVENSVWKRTDNTSPIITVSSAAPTCSYKTNGKIFIDLNAPGQFNISLSDLLGNKMLVHTNVSQADTLKNLAPGKYPVAIVACSADAFQILDTVVVMETEKIAANAQVNHLRYRRDIKAGIAVTDITGGKAPYSYKWSNGQKTPVASNLKKGFHSLVITDAAGCRDTNYFVLREVKMEAPAAVTLSHLSTSSQQDFSYVKTNSTRLKSQSLTTAFLPARSAQKKQVKKGQ